jgi:LPXTG-site transpeptidase (sortase) family protein
LKDGDEITLTTPLGRHTYKVVGQPGVVLPTQYAEVVDEYPSKGSFLTLTSCHPEGAATHRIVVRAKLVKSIDTLAQASS